MYYKELFECHQKLKDKCLNLLGKIKNYEIELEQAWYDIDKLIKENEELKKENEELKKQNKKGS